MVTNHRKFTGRNVDCHIDGQKGRMEKTTLVSSMVRFYEMRRGVGDQLEAIE